MYLIQNNLCSIGTGFAVKTNLQLFVVKENGQKKKTPKFQLDG